MPAVEDLFPSDHVTFRIIFLLRDLEALSCETRVVDGTMNRSAEPWTNADRFFLADALARGMSIAEVAAFLGRTEDEVRGAMRGA
jgi:hypothetical protein